VKLTYFTSILDDKLFSTEKQDNSDVTIK